MWTLRGLESKVCRQRTVGFKPSQRRAFGCPFSMLRVLVRSEDRISTLNHASSVSGSSTWGARSNDGPRELGS